MGLFGIGLFGVVALFITVGLVGGGERVFGVDAGGLGAGGEK